MREMIRRELGNVDKTLADYDVMQAHIETNLYKEFSSIQNF